MRTWILFALSALPLFAQFSGLSSTYDGQELYFSSQLLLTGQTRATSEYRVFHLKNGKIDLFAERDLSVSGALSGSGGSDGATGVQVSDDGLTVAYTLQGECVVPNSCTPVFTTNGSLAILAGPTGRTLGAGIVAMSKNAQWAVISNQAGPNTPITGVGGTVVAVPQSVLVNLITNERTTLPEPVALFNRSGPVLASDGTVMLSGTQGGPGLWKAGGFIPLVVPGSVSLQMVSDNGRMLVYSQLVQSASACVAGGGICPNPRLLVRDEWNGIDVLISNGLTGVMGLSNDGRHLLYRTTGPTAAGPAFIADTVYGDSVPIPLGNGELALDGTLSGDGGTAFLVTTKGRIVSVDLLHGLSVHTLVAPTPYVSNSGPMAAGSFTHLTGNLPDNIDAVKGKIFLNDIAVPVLGANAAGVDVQIPWEVIGKATLTLNLGSDSPFQQTSQVFVLPSAPRFLETMGDQPNVIGFLAIKGDFSGLLTTSPAPGDIIVMYGTGLGPVLNHPATGEPTPTDRLYPLVSPLTCHFSPYTLPLETLFAGLAPGLTGVYQINFRMPPGPNLGEITGGQCSFGGGGFSWARLVAPSRGIGPTVGFGGLPPSQ